MIDFREKRDIPFCAFCEKPTENIIKNISPQRFCDEECYINWSFNILEIMRIFHNCFCDEKSSKKT